MFFTHFNPKDISGIQFTVFITEPISLEAVIRQLPFTSHCPIYPITRSADKRYVLSVRGYALAKRALDSLNKKAEFIILHLTEFQSFLDNYHREYKSVEELLDEARRELMQTTWRNRADVFRKKMNLQKTLDMLYRDLYRGRFGEDAAFLYEEEIVKHLSQLGKE